MSKTEQGGLPIQPIALSPSRRQQVPRKPRRPMPPPIEIGNGKDPRVALGRVVHRQRLKLGISQEDFADRVGLDRTYVSGIERGIRNPTLLVLVRLAQVLSVPAARLLEPEDEDGQPSRTNPPTAREA